LATFKPLAGSDRRPLHVQTIEALQNKIENGDLAPGDKFPAEASLATSLGISRATLREALGHLESRGLIIRRQGVGTFVAKPYGGGVLAGLERLEPFRNLTRRAGLKSKVVERSVTCTTAGTELAAGMAVDPGTELIRVEVVEAIDNQRCMYIDDNFHIPLVYLDEMSLFQGSAIQYLKEEVEPPLSHSRTEIFSTPASKEIAKKLDIEEGTAILFHVETYYSLTGTILGIGLAYFLTDHFHFFITRRVT
jgi:GntR family transcriptional regulator